MINVKELTKVCPGCNGEKWLQDVEWVEWNKKLTKREEELKLEGKSFIGARDQAIEELEMPDCPEEHPCGECDGKGEVLTDQGVEVIHFVRKWL